jgi:hypothetical protein
MEVSCGMKVFISYAQADASLAGKVKDALERDGLKVYGYIRDLPSIRNIVNQQLKEADAMVVLLTPEATNSMGVRAEIDYALGEKNFRGRLIPVLVGAPERFPENSIPWILRRLKMINIPEHGRYEDSIWQITKALKEVA